MTVHDVDPLVSLSPRHLQPQDADHDEPASPSNKMRDLFQMETLPPKTASQPLNTYQLQSYLLPDSVKDMKGGKSVYKSGCISAVLGQLQDYTIAPTQAHAQKVLGTCGTELAARAAQVGMLALIMLAITHFTGLGFIVSLSIAIGAILCVALPGIIAHKVIAHRRLNADTEDARKLRAMRDNLMALETELKTHLEHSKGHLELLAETRRTLAQINASWFFLIGQAVSRAKMPIVLVASVAYNLARISPPGRKLAEVLEKRNILDRKPPRA